MKNLSHLPYSKRYLIFFLFILSIAYIAPGCGGGGGGGGGTTVDNTAPTVPANVTAEAISISEIDITWSASTDKTGVDGYRIFRNGIALPDTSPDESYSDTGLIDDTQYCYNITAFDAAGNDSAQSTVACATTLEITGKLTASDASAADQFGFSVAISGDYAIVGAQGDDTNPDDTGSAYIYHRIGPDTWGEEVKITASDADEDDRFGWSVAIDGDFALVGAAFDKQGGNSAGAAYMFLRTSPGNNWGIGTKLMAQNTDEFDRFGWSVAISNNFAVVGSIGDDDMNTDSGAVYIYKIEPDNSLANPQKIPSPDAGITDLFGASVAISGNYIIVGASSTEAAYIYQWSESTSTWDFMMRLTAPEVNQGDLFGFSVAIDGEYVLVGAWGTSQSDGTAYIFKRTGSAWDNGVKIIPSDAGTGDNFGKSVSIKGDYAIVGADNYDAGGGFSKIGTAYIFQRTGPDNIWDSGTQIFADDFEKDASFGNAVSISIDRAIVGSLLKNSEGSNEGAAYIFDIPPM